MSDARWGDPREYGERARDDERSRVYESRDGDDRDPRYSLMHDLDLPRGEERELVVDRDRVYELNGEDGRTLAAVLAGPATTAHDLNNPQFPLRRFVVCDLCTTPLTGSAPKGRSKWYSYYHCRKCKGVSARKE